MFCVMIATFSFKIPLNLLSRYTSGPGDRFSKVPVTFRARNQILKSKIQRIRVRVLASILLHFDPLTDGFIMLDAKLLKSQSLM